MSGAPASSIAANAGQMPKLGGKQAEVRAAETIFEVGQNCCAVSRAHRVAFLVDAEAYFNAFVEAAERAERSIIVLAWDFDSQTSLSFDEGNTCTKRLGDFLNDLARRRKRLHVHVLDWDYPMLYATDRELPPIYGLGWKPHRRVHFRYDNTHPFSGSHHQKIVVIDDRIAFVGGLDITGKRWDTPEHRPEDPRRTAGDKPYPPFHDTMIVVDGDAAKSLAVIARKRWARATGNHIEPVETESDPWPASLAPAVLDVDIGVACTVPKTDVDPGARQVERLYLDMIARARRYIYMENQYFTSDNIGDALAKRLVEPDGPEMVLVSRLLSHGWLEEVTMTALRNRLLLKLRDADAHRRFHAYYPDMPGLAEGTCIDVHSKVMVVDDAWLRIGSANLCNRSMGMDTECDVVVEARGDERVARSVRGFLTQLMGEHLGVEPVAVKRALEEHGSLQGAIEALASETRTLKRLEAKDDVSEAALTAAAIADPEAPVSLDSLSDYFAPGVDSSRSGPAWGKVILVALVLAGLALAWRFTPLAEIVTAGNVTDWARAFGGRWWATLIVIAAPTVACIIMFPRPLITLAAVLAFGAWLGFVYAMAGILVAALATYFAGRLLRRDTVRRLAGRKLNRLSEAMRQRGLLAMTAVRLVPIAPFAVVGLVAGAIRIKFSHYALGTFLGNLPGVLAATVFADQIAVALEDTAKVNWWVVGGVLAALLLGTIAVRRWLGGLSATRIPPK
jgi:phospholipase D1/2